MADLEHPIEPSDASVKGLEKTLISRKLGIIFFASAMVVLALLAFIAIRSQPSQKSLPTPSHSSSSTTSPTSPTPTPSKTLPGQAAADREVMEGPAVSLALNLSNRSWQSSQEHKLLRIHNLIDPSLYVALDTYVSSWNWAGCVSTKCELNANIYSVSLTLTSDNQHLVHVVISVSGANGTSYPNQDYSFVVAPDSTGTWYVVGLKSLPLPQQ